MKKQRVHQEWAGDKLGRKYILAKVADPNGQFADKDFNRYNLVKRYI